jgi:hypothetical protein
MGRLVHKPRRRSSSLSQPSSERYGQARGTARAIWCSAPEWPNYVQGALPRQCIALAGIRCSDEAATIAPGWSRATSVPGGPFEHRRESVSPAEPSAGSPGHSMNLGSRPAEQRWPGRRGTPVAAQSLPSAHSRLPGLAQLCPALWPGYAHPQTCQRWPAARSVQRMSSLDRASSRCYSRLACRCGVGSALARRPTPEVAPNCVHALTEETPA